MSAPTAAGAGLPATSIIQIIESVAPLAHQASWDLSGVQVAGRKAFIKKVAVTLDPRPDSVHAALAWGADFILCHHPLTLSPRLPNRLDNTHDVLRAMFRADAWLYSAHTSLDCQLDGPPSWLAREFGLQGLIPVEPIAAGDREHGFGILGRLPGSLATEQVLERLGSILGRDFLLAAGGAPEVVDCLAYCPGSGGSMADKAFALGAQVFITGEVKHHQAVEAAAGPVGNGGRLIVDVGHHILEERMMQAFHTVLAPELAAGGVDAAFFSTAEPLRLWRGQA